MSLHDFLTANKAPRTIDYLSIDTEGSEFSILETFPFDKWDIQVISVEHNYESQREQIHALLTGCGFERIENQWDDYYISTGLLSTV